MISDPTYPVYRVNPTTGVISFAFQPTLSGSPAVLSSMAITKNGQGYALYEQALYQLNLTTGALKLVAANNVTDLDIDFLAADPTTGKLVGASYSTGDLWEFDPSTGEATKLGQIPISDGNAVTSLAFDSSGYLWAMMNEGGTGTTSDLFRMDDPITTPFPAVVNSIVSSGLMSYASNGGKFFSYALFITWPAAALPTTGVDPTQGILWSFALLALGTFAVGVGVYRRRRPRLS
jgi:hypothetical protein